MVPWHPPCALLRLIFRRFNPKTIFFSGIATGLNRNDLIYTSLRLAPPCVNLSSFLYSCQGAWALSPSPAGVRRTLKMIQSKYLTLYAIALNLTVLCLTETISDFGIDLGMSRGCFHPCFLPRKEVIQPHLPIRLPCYDFTPVIDLTFGGWLLAVIQTNLISSVSIDLESTFGFPLWFAP